MQSKGYEIDIITSDENELITIIIVCNSLSLVGSLLMIICYIKLKNVQSYAFKLVTCLNLADILMNIGHLMHFSRTVGNNETIICQAQAFIINFSQLSSILWTSIIAWTLYQSVIHGLNQSYLNFGCFYSISIIVPFLFSIYPIFTNDYGYAGIQCWIKDDLVNPSLRSKYIRLINFYIPLILVILFNVIAYIRVMIFLYKLVEPGTDKQFIYKIILYPIILVVCWIWTIFDRGYSEFNDEVFWLTCVTIAFQGLMGLFNSVAYGFTPQVREQLSKLCCRQSMKISSIQFELEQRQVGDNRSSIQSETDNETDKYDFH